MWAIQQATFGGPEVLVWKELETPRPKPGEVLLRVTAAPVNRFDAVSRRGDYPNMTLPRIPGMDCAGVVEEYSGSRHDLSPGTPVVVLGATLGNGGPGGYATHVCVAETEVFPTPANSSPRDATCLAMTYLTAWYALNRRASIAAGQTLLVPGAGGGVALATVQLAKLAGIRVLATTGSEQKRQRLLALGVEACFLYRDGHIPEQITAATQGAGVDFVIDTVGGASIAQGVACLKPRGSLITLGIVQGGQFTVDAISFLLKEAALYGVNVGQLLPAQRFDIVSHLLDEVRSGRLTVLIDRTFPMPEAAAAHAYLESDRAFGKLVLEPPPA